MISSWPGPDPAIHVDHQVKPGDDDVRYAHFQLLNHRDGEAVRITGIETSLLDLCVSVVNFLDAPNKSGHDGLVNSDELTLFDMVMTICG